MEENICSIILTNIHGEDEHGCHLPEKALERDTLETYLVLKICGREIFLFPSRQTEMVTELTFGNILDVY